MEQKGPWVEWNRMALPGAADPPRYLGGYPSSVCVCNGMDRPPKACSRRREENPDHADGYAVRKF